MSRGEDPGSYHEREEKSMEVKETSDIAQEEKKFEEITLKFGKGCVGEAFKGKDGNEYRKILIPNKDENDHSPWASFVVKANAVHDDKFGKGMWTKLPAEGHTTIRKEHCVGENAEGKKIWESDSRQVTNRELKSMVEFYKTRNREERPQEEKPRESLAARLSEKKSEVEQVRSDAPRLAMDKAKANTL